MQLVKQRLHGFINPRPPLTQVEEMLISSVIPMISLYRLPHGQYGYNGHVINLHQDVPSFINKLPRHPNDLDIIVVRQQNSS